MYGLTVEEASAPPVEVWPDNAGALNVMIAMATQWRAGFSGPTGLDYAALPAVFELLRIPRDERADVFDGLRVMEDAALELFRELAEKKGR